MHHPDGPYPAPAAELVPEVRYDHSRPHATPHTPQCLPPPPKSSGSPHPRPLPGSLCLQGVPAPLTHVHTGVCTHTAVPAAPGLCPASFLPCSQQTGPLTPWCSAQRPLSASHDLRSPLPALTPPDSPHTPTGGTGQAWAATSCPFPPAPSILQPRPGVPVASLHRDWPLSQVPSPHSASWF